MAALTMTVNMKLRLLELMPQAVLKDLGASYNRQGAMQVFDEGHASNVSRS
jgi:hypothetical protein